MRSFLSFLYSQTFYTARKVFLPGKFKNLHLWKCPAVQCWGVVLCLRLQFSVTVQAKLYGDKWNCSGHASSSRASSSVGFSQIRIDLQTVPSHHAFRTAGAGLTTAPHPNTPRIKSSPSFLTSTNFLNCMWYHLFHIFLSLADGFIYMNKPPPLFLNLVSFDPFNGALRLATIFSVAYVFLLLAWFEFVTMFKGHPLWRASQTEDSDIYICFVATSYLL